MSRAEYLFFYGTLLSGTASPHMMRILSRCCRPARRASIQGRMFDLGAYPGAVTSSDPDDRVWGRLYALRSSRDCLTLLDRYEDFDPADEAMSLYLRRRVTAVEYPTARPRECWTYIYNGSLAHRPRIISGDWIAYLQGRRRPARRRR